MKERAAGENDDEYHVGVEGQPFTTRTHGYTIWWAAAEAISHPVTVDDGVLEIDFDSSAGPPHIAAIEIEALR